MLTASPRRSLVKVAVAVASAGPYRFQIRRPGRISKDFSMTFGVRGSPPRKTADRLVCGFARASDSISTSIALHSETTQLSPTLLRSTSASNRAGGRTSIPGGRTQMSEPRTSGDTPPSITKSSRSSCSPESGHKWPSMGLKLLRKEPVFREVFEQCDGSPVPGFQRQRSNHSDRGRGVSAPRPSDRALREISCPLVADR